MIYTKDMLAFMRDRIGIEDNNTSIARAFIDTFGVGEVDCVRKKVAKLRGQDETTDVQNRPDKHEEQENTASSVVHADHPLTIDEVAKVFGVDLKIWKALKIITNSWSTYFQTKVWWERIGDELNMDEVLAIFTEKASKYAPPKKIWKAPASKKGVCLAEFPVYDLHFGRYAWGESTGADYDSKIAKERLFSAFTDLTNKTKCFDIGRVLLTLGGDILNHDTVQGTTSSGLTPQDSDSRIHKLFSEAIDMFVEVIDNLLTIGPVDIVSVSGNHDEIMAHALAETLRVWYRNNDLVNIDCSPKLRKYYQFGSNLLGITHGNLSQKAIKELPMIMAAESPLWSESKHREFQYGHLHSEKSVSYVASEDHYCMTRRMPSLASPCQWTYSSAFVGSKQKQNAIIFHETEGLVAVFDSINF